MKWLSIIVLSLVLASCAHKEKSEVLGIGTKAPAKKSEQSVAAPAAPKQIEVDANDQKALDKMTKAVEKYVIKKDIKQFNKLCKDKRFDCFVNEKPFPKNKKAIARSVPPFASGSKMGLHGEERVQVRYDFYP
ncbi:hypothetical protein [Bdellovibrio reynosensis]|uniref:Uncharacterized protein n=1 Tax=Bdellovibrio reynosensis TaxID=2835041 RepID=A0ABY4CFW5_9BACT|nr:hypothetical protein [Bdellovibrio reynosensis]UOF02681.1 hypothetical protein MNR06_06930 [Bdellovibrio reynosensis]